MDRKERTELFFARLAEAPCCATAAAAFEQLAETLNAVENEFTSIPYNPATWESDGRLYAPQADQRRAVTGHPDITRYRSKGHSSFIGENGAIKIEQQGGRICLDKPGADGRTIVYMMANEVSKSSARA